MIAQIGISAHIADIKLKSSSGSNEQRKDASLDIAHFLVTIAHNEYISVDKSDPKAYDPKSTG